MSGPNLRRASRLLAAGAARSVADSRPGARHTCQHRRLAARLPAGGRSRRPEQVGHGPHVAPQFCDPSARRRGRHSGDPGPARTPAHQTTAGYARVAVDLIAASPEPARTPGPGGDPAGLSAGHVASEARSGGYLPPPRRRPACRNRAHLSLAQRRVMTAIEVCRTAALGGHVERCEDCAHTRIAYNSCRNRHCPKCQGRARGLHGWRREAELLPVPYFHVVFTLPAALGAIAYRTRPWSTTSCSRPPPRR